jgi:site-specific DNA-methyltransferase (adenine-specific)
VEFLVELNKIYNEDCITGIEKIDFPVHLVVTSPPYNVDLGNNKLYKRKYDLYDDNLPIGDYLDFITNVFTKVYNKQEDDGRVCINIGDKKNGEIPLHSFYIDRMYEIGYKSYTTILWHKHQVGNRTSWGSFKSPSCPSFPVPFEYILCFYKNSKKLLHRGETDLEKQEFIDWSLSLWNFPPETQQKKMGHPAMFPTELPRRLIKMLSWIGDTVLDPFSGLGTTCMVAKQLNRNYVGFEISPNYCSLSEKRINSVEINEV